jgi:hypothetical protein
MDGIWGHYDLPLHAVHHGVMAQGNWAADYYTSQPDPSHWIAVGLVAPLDAGSPGLRRMLVGEGRTEDEAIHALCARIAELSGDSQFTVFPKPSAHREDRKMTSPKTCARIYRAGGDRFTVPCAAFIREDPRNGLLLCTDANGCPVKTVKKDQVIGYLVFTCQSGECFQA